MDPLLLPWQRFLGKGLRKNQALQNGYDVTVTSYLNQSQQIFVIWLKILNFSKIG